MTNLEQQALIYNALGDHIRLVIILALYTHKDTITVQGLTDYVCKHVVPIKQPSISHHLRLLYDTGLIEYRKEWHTRYYSICPDKMDIVEQALFGGTHFD